MPSTTVVPEIKSHVIKESINDQNLLPNELFEGEIARANEFGEGRWEIRRQGSEWALLALKSYVPGDLVLTSKKEFYIMNRKLNEPRI
ncbi:unnamed protein product [Oikopleura dioica]|uniref:Uncharacterized protein n=1 Tax=Oikopleura dioica TaxID=34765 RepID=E4YKM1_OIKDI|nr:unnamed protein product [Oikopleura dioica]